MKLNWNFQRGGEVFGKIPSVGEVWLFSGTTHYQFFVATLAICILDCETVSNKLSRLLLARFDLGEGNYFL